MARQFPLGKVSLFNMHAKSGNSGISVEIFDVVNHNDQVIGRLPREVVHRRKLLHRSVYGIAVNSSKDVYLQFRSPFKDSNPNKWDFSVSGHVEAGETYGHAIIRETQEELGLELSIVPTRLFKLQASPDSDYEFSWVYRIHDNGPFVLDRSEAVKGKWFSADEITSGICEEPNQFTSGLKLIWNKVLAGNYLNG